MIVNSAYPFASTIETYSQNSFSYSVVKEQLKNTGSEKSRTDRVHQYWSSIVAYNVGNTVRDPRSDNIAIMKTGDSWGYEALCTEMCCGTEPNLVQLLGVEDNLFIGVGVGCVVQRFVGEGMGQMGKGIAVPRNSKPGKKRILNRTRQGPSIGSRSGRPNIFASSERLHEL